MAFLFTYAGFPVDVPTPQVLEWVDAEIQQFPLLEDLPQSPWRGKNIFGLALNNWDPIPEVGVGQFYYPVGMSRWSICRFVASGTQVQGMAALALQGGVRSQRLTIQCDVTGAGQGKNYLVQTPMRMLPPRPLAVHTPGAGSQPLFLVTLVDERYHFQNQAIPLQHPDFTTTSGTWLALLNNLSANLGISLNLSSLNIVNPNYTFPEPDSHFWTNWENSALMLDAVAANVGCRVIRNMDGTYTLDDPLSAFAQVQTNRGKVVRTAGGDVLGSLEGVISASPLAINAVLPAKIAVTFPRFALKPLPHFVNSRYAVKPRPSSWIEDSYGDTFSFLLTLRDVGFGAFQGYPGTKVFHDTAKAFVNNDLDVTPLNFNQLLNLATQVGNDYCNWQAGACLDETYPGTLAWTPEGFHDILWTFRRERHPAGSTMDRIHQEVAGETPTSVPEFWGGRATTRVFRCAANRGFTEFQHSSGTALVKGVGGRSVAAAVIGDSGTVDSPNVFKFIGTTVSQGRTALGLLEAVINVQSCGCSDVSFNNSGIVNLRDQYMGRGTKFFDAIAFGPPDFSTGLPATVGQNRAHVSIFAGIMGGAGGRTGAGAGSPSYDVALTIQTTRPDGTTRMTGATGGSMGFFLSMDPNGLPNGGFGALQWIPQIAGPGFAGPKPDPKVYTGVNSSGGGNVIYEQGAVHAETVFSVGFAGDNRLQVPPPPAPTAVRISKDDPRGHGLNPIWFGPNVIYQITYTNPFGESNAPPGGGFTTPPVAVDSGGLVLLNWQQAPPDLPVMGYKIYRVDDPGGPNGLVTAQSQGKWSLVAQINDVTITTFVDNGVIISRGPPPQLGGEGLNNGQASSDGITRQGAEAGIDVTITPGMTFVVKGGLIVRQGTGTAPNMPGNSSPAMQGGAGNFSSVSSQGSVSGSQFVSGSVPGGASLSTDPGASASAFVGLTVGGGGIGQ